VARSCAWLETPLPPRQAAHGAQLEPSGYREELLREPTITDSGKIIVYTNDEDLFWQQPS
jgi:hypothetical protein